VRLDLDKLVPLLIQQAETTGTLQFDGWTLWALDHSPYPRQDAPTVSDRGSVHGADGIVVGHQYSLLGRVMFATGSWVGVVHCQRIATHQTPTAVGAAQIAQLKQHARWPRIITADSEYVTDEILDEADEQTRLLLRFKGNRKLFQAPPPKAPGSKGRPAQHGPKLQLNRAETLRTPDQHYRVEQAHGGWVEISVWRDVHVQSRPQLPLCAVRVEVFRANGQRRYKRPLWLAWTGPADVDWPQFWRVYLQRFCLECVHQFTKNSLAWTRGRFGHTGRARTLDVACDVSLLALTLSRARGSGPVPPLGKTAAVRATADARTGATRLLAPFLPAWESDERAQSARQSARPPKRLSSGPAAPVSDGL
jgi:hypothetical protein